MWYSKTQKRNLPKEFDKPNFRRERGHFDWKITEDGLLVMEWMNKKPVLFINNFHKSENTLPVVRRKKEMLQDVSCPKLYQRKVMVDKADILKKFPTLIGNLLNGITHWFGAL